MKTNTLFKFLGFTHKFASIERSVKLVGRKALETDAEHSFQLALLAWFVSDNLKIKLDKQKIFQYALAHDLVEAYAGDTDPHKHSKKYKASKGLRETRAFQKIRREFKTFPDLHATIKKYETLAENEAKLVYLLDKVVPVINTYLSRDTYYFDNGVSFKKWESWLEEKLKKAGPISPELNAFIKSLKKFFGQVNNKFFSN